MRKNLVVCCDGTDDKFGENNTNVVKLYSILLRQADKQVTFYVPGLGTFPASGALLPATKWITQKMGAAFGYGLSNNLAISYGFLMENYTAGDQIYLFGFSRGAYTVRVLAAMIHTCGLMSPQNRNLIPYAVDLFKAESTHAKKKNDREEQRTGQKLPLNLPVCTRFKQVFSTSPAIHFMGLWDTVSSIGSIYDPFSLPYTHWNPSVVTVRHAIAIDEMRKFFRTNLWASTPSGTDVKQVWFAGDHGDIGGGYPEAESGLAKIPLAWMLDEAYASGLLLDADQMASILGNPHRGLSFAPANPMAVMHNELDHPFWKLAQWIPRRHWVRNLNTGQYKLQWNLSPKPTPRLIEDGALVHRTVFERMQGDPSYRPVNLPANDRPS
ncbi:MAG: T6SS phospholipase effector Tle1-like catalytic domain-containing protein [Acidobacteriaceae bacterium]